MRPCNPCLNLFLEIPREPFARVFIDFFNRAVFVHSALRFYLFPDVPSSVSWNLIHSIKTMDWTKFQLSPTLTHEQIAIPDHPGAE